MSAALLGLAMTADVPSPRAKLVVMALCNWSNDQGRNIFPSVASVAEIAMCNERTAQRILRVFEAAGLLHVVRAGGGKPGSSTIYALDLEVLRRLAQPNGWALLTGKTNADHDADYDNNPSDNGEDADDSASDVVEGGEARGVTPVSPLPPRGVTKLTERGDMGVTRSLKETLKTEREAGEPGLEGEEGFARFVAIWPTSAADDLDRTKSTWDALTDAERGAALAGVSGFLATLAKAGRKIIPAGSTYLAQRRWELLPRPAADAAPAAPAGVAAWSRDWWWLLIDRINRGGAAAVSFQLAQAQRNAGLVPKAGETIPDTSALMRTYPARGEVYAAWRGWFRARGVRLDVPAGDFWVFLPGDDPAIFSSPAMTRPANTPSEVRP